jgi:hypothetical protein
VDSNTYTYTRSNGHGGSESRTTTVNRARGTCQSLITRTDGHGHVYSDVITGPGCDNTGDYYRGGSRYGMGMQGMPMYSNNNCCISVVSPPVVSTAPPAISAAAPGAPGAPDATPAAAPAGQPMMPPTPMVMGTVPIYSYNTGMPVLPTGTACGYAQGYGFYR